jgi:hypothetical protein
VRRRHDDFREAVRRHRGERHASGHDDAWRVRTYEVLASTWAATTRWPKCEPAAGPVRTHGDVLIGLRSAAAGATSAAATTRTTPTMRIIVGDALAAKADMARTNARAILVTRHDSAHLCTHTHTHTYRGREADAQRRRAASETVQQSPTSQQANHQVSLSLSFSLFKQSCSSTAREERKCVCVQAADHINSGEMGGRGRGGERGPFAGGARLEKVRVVLPHDQIRRSAFHSCRPRPTAPIRSRDDVMVWCIEPTSVG